ncbi:DUF4398 domain-containing protein [Chromatocurvus halotolerans]|uniref:Uncharacterized protein DUF4398 n=1 Tax=Chromatocurvus halotolerans TaxID=1132028 RepID=A0A4R2KKG0_9GAMM|nr:DUF4398 domain-containing protein [Chromatocurvus halotolerans]TCO74481.1 uncharacterized protein DUF4398 [Chromatocurvus halotolerans]
MHPSTRATKSAHLRNALGVTFVLALASACGTAPVAPTAVMEAARQAIASAEESGARQHAAAELDEAREKLMLADRSVRSEQMVDAERLAQESMITGQLAVARTEAAKAAEINREMQRSVDAMMEEMRRRGDRQ